MGGKGLRTGEEEEGRGEGRGDGRHPPVRQSARELGRGEGGLVEEVEDEVEVGVHPAERRERAQQVGRLRRARMNGRRPQPVGWRHLG